MVHGIEIFREHFKEFSHQYVLIGGTACDILLDDLGSSFRATKDLDIVLIIEFIDKTFSDHFWKFVEVGGYKHREVGIDKNQFYRFSNPSNSLFPRQIELFCRLPDNIELEFKQRCIPIVITGSIVSLSAILLDEEYYNLLVTRKVTINELSLIDIETLIVFKIKAWLDNKYRKEIGESVDANDVKKHKNDVFRLLVNLTPDSKIFLSEEIKFDIHQFIEKVSEERPELKSLGIKSANLDELLTLLKDVFIGT